MFTLFLVLLCLSSAPDTSHGHSSDLGNQLIGMTDINTIVTSFGKNLGKHVTNRLTNHLRRTGISMLHFEKEELDSNHRPLACSHAGVQCLLLGLGNSTLTNLHLPESKVAAFPHESFSMIQMFPSNFSGGEPITVVSNGRAMAANNHPNATKKEFRKPIDYGAVVGSYHTLEWLGFAFLHPLQPYAPSSIQVNTSGPTVIEQHEAPRWPDRNFHIHTQHPLELNEVLQGMDVPMMGKGVLHADCKDQNDDDGHFCERWEDMVPDVDVMFEWCVANRLNKVEWLLLGNYKWQEFDSSDFRKKRLNILTKLGQSYGLLVGADVPIGNIQQHGWSIVNPRLPLNQQIDQIHTRVDWVFDAGFDFISTESGMSEFTHPDCSLMLDLLNAFAIYVNVTWGREAAVKVHCSTKQTCSEYLDPRTNEPINFNFLTYYAHSSLGVLPHTVQVYGLGDPIGGAYGNKDYTDIEEYMYFEASQKNRSVVFYPETSYWVSVDIDVPLFLPLYGQRRQHDLRRIARKEIASQQPKASCCTLDAGGEVCTNPDSNCNIDTEPFRIQGQMIFDSGWEWGYWLNDLIAARASWDPAIDIENEWDAFGHSLQPFLNILHPTIAEKFRDIMVSLTRSQLSILIYGKINGIESPALKGDTIHSGIAYLSGSDTWYDVPRMFGVEGLQPLKIHLDEVSDPLFEDALRLIEHMQDTFTASDKAMEALLLEQSNLATSSSMSNSKFHDPIVMDLLQEMKDSIAMLALRATQVRLLYASKLAEVNIEHASAAALQQQARSVLSKAELIVRQREEAYRVPWQRIGSWRENPTVYRFGYLWAVHSLYYWWRDQGISEKGSLQSKRSPCYLNRMDASETVMGFGKTVLEGIRYMINTYSPFKPGYPLEIINCIAPPAEGYTFPQDLYN